MRPSNRSGRAVVVGGLSRSTNKRVLEKRGLLARAAVVAAAGLTGASAHAASLTWAGPSGTDWLGANAWLDGAVPATWANANPDAGTFDLSGGTQVVNVGGLVTQAGVTVNGGNALTINATAASVIDGSGAFNGDVLKTGAASLTLEHTGGFNGTLGIGGGGVVFNNTLATSTGTLLNLAGGTASLGVAFAGQTLTVGQLSGTTGGIDTGSGAGTAAAGVRTLLVNQNTDTTFAGRITDSQNAGGATLGLTKDGAGVLTISGANNYLGPTQVLGGTLKAGNGSAFGNSNGGAITVSAGATLDVNAQNLTAKPVFVSGSGVGGNGAIINSSATQQQNALLKVTLTGDTTFGGTGRWDIRGATNTGFLSTGGQAYNLTKVGGNQVNLVSVSVDPALGDIDIQAGILGYEGATTGLGDPTKTVTVAGGATLQMWNAANALNKKIVLNGGGTLLSANNPNSIAAAAAVTLNGGTVAATAGTLTVAAPVGVTADSFVNAAGGTVVMTGALSGAGALTKVGNNAWQLNGTAAGYTGAITVNSGQLQVLNDNALGGTTGVTVDNTGTTFGGSGARLDLVGNVTINGVPLALNSNLSGTNQQRSSLLSNGTNNTWGGNITVTGVAPINLQSDAGMLTINGSVSGSLSDTLFIRGVGNGTLNGVVNTPGANVVKTDTGTWTINSTGNAWNNTTIAVGRVNAGADDVLPVTTSLTMGQGDTNAPTFDLMGFDQTVANLAINPGASGAKTITNTNTNAASTFTVNTSGSNTYGGVGNIAGNLNLTKDGSGTLTLTSGMTFTGETRVKAGTLVLGASNAIGLSTLNLVAGDTGALGFGTNTAVTVGGLKGDGNLDTSPLVALNVGNNNTGTTYVGNLTGGAAFNKVGNGVLTLAGDNGGFGGSFNANGGTLLFSPVSALPGFVTINAGGGAGWSSNLDQNFLTRVSASSTGAAVLTGDSAAALDFTGLPSVRLGVAAGATATYTGAYTPATPGTYLLGGGGGSLNFAPLITGGDTVTVGGPGVVALTNPANDFTGVASVVGGSLKLTGAGVGSTSGATVVTLGGTVDLNGQTVAEPITLSGTLAGNRDGAAFVANSAASVATLTGTVTISGSNGVNIGGTGGDIVIDGPIGGGTNNQSLYKVGGNKVTLTNTANNYATRTSVYNGTLSFSQIGNAGQASQLGVGSTNDNARIEIDGANAFDPTLQYTGGSVQTDRKFYGFRGRFEITDADAVFAINQQFVGNATTNPGVTKVGPGALVLGGTSDNASLVFIAGQGLTELAKNSGAGPRAVANLAGVSNGATVRMTGAGNDQIFDNVNAALTGGTLDLNGRSEGVQALVGSGTSTVTNTSANNSYLWVGTNNGGNTYSGAIAETAAGAIGLLKVGSGNQTVSGANDYSLGTWVFGGQLNFVSATNVGGTGANVHLYGNGTLVAGNVDNTLLQRIAPDSVGGGVAFSTAFGASSAAGIDLSLAPAGTRLGAQGNFNLTGTITPNANNAYVLGGGGAVLVLPTANALTGARSLDVAGPGRVSLTAANNLSGAVLVRGGGIEMNGAGSLTGTSGITVQSDGTTISGLGAGTTRAGFLYMQDATVNNRFGAAPITLQGGTIHYYRGGTTGSGSNTVTNVISDSGLNTLQSVANGGANVLQVTNLTRPASNYSTIDFRSPTGAIGAAATAGYVRVTNLNGSATPTGAMPAWATVNQTDFAQYASGTNGVQILATNVTNAPGSWTASSVALLNAAQTQTASLTVGSLITERDLQLDNGAVLTVANGNVIMRTNNHWIKSVTGGGFIQSGLASGELYVTSAFGRTDTRFNGVVVQDNGATPLTLIKSGDGTFGLTSANTYTGGTYVNAGVLQVFNNGALGSTNGATFVRHGATLDIGGNNLNLGAEQVFAVGVGVNGNGAITNNSGTNAQNAFRYVTLTGDTTLGGNNRWDVRSVGGPTGMAFDAGNFAVTKVGANQISLVGPGTVNMGNLFIHQGTFQFEAQSEFMGATGNVYVSPVGTLGFWTAPGMTQSKPVFMNGGTFSTGNGTNGALAYNGQITLNVDSTFRIDSETTLNVPLAGAGGLTKTGASRLVLPGSQNYTGPTVITGGTLVVDTLNDGGAPSGIGQAGSAAANLVLNGGTLAYTGPNVTLNRLFTLGYGTSTIDAGPNGLTLANTSTLDVIGTGNHVLNLSGTGTGANGGVIATTIAGDKYGGTVGISKTNSGTWTITGNNSFSGGVTVNAGTLVVAHANALGNTVGDTYVRDDNGAGAIGAQLLLDHPTGMTIAENFRTSGNGGPGDGSPTGPGVIRSVSGNNVLTGTLTNIGGGGSSTYTVDAGSTLTLAGTITHDPALTRVLSVGGAGDGFISGAMVNAPGANNIGLDKQGAGTWTVSGANHAYTGPTTVNGTGTLRVTGSVAASSGVTVNSGTFDAAGSQTVKSLTVNAGGVTTVTAGVLKVGTGATAAPLVNAGRIDLVSNGLIVDTSSGNDAAALTAVRDQILSGYNAGDWAGATGITSATAAAGASSRGVGYALASEAAPGGTFMGAPVDADAVVARYTLLGDATLDGAVDFNDLVKLAQNYNTVDGSRVWFTGDFTYDGNVDFNDLVKLAQNYNSALPTEPVPGASASFSADLSAAFAAVPEPGAVSLLAVAGAALAGRRRRRTGR